MLIRCQIKKTVLQLLNLQCQHHNDNVQLNQSTKILQTCGAHKITQHLLIVNTGLVFTHDQQSGVVCSVFSSVHEGMSLVKHGSLMRIGEACCAPRWYPFCLFSMVTPFHRRN